MRCGDVSICTLHLRVCHEIYILIWVAWSSGMQQHWNPHEAGQKNSIKMITPNLGLSI